MSTERFICWYLVKNCCMAALSDSLSPAVNEGFRFNTQDLCQCLLIRVLRRQSEGGGCFGWRLERHLRALRLVAKANLPVLTARTVKLRPASARIAASAIRSTSYSLCSDRCSFSISLIKFSTYLSFRLARSTRTVSDDAHRRRRVMLNRRMLSDLVLLRAPPGHAGATTSALRAIGSAVAAHARAADDSERLSFLACRLRSSL